MNAPESTTTRPYLIRALHEWCTDNGFTPYLAVRVDQSVQVPREYVNDGEIVLNVGIDATHALQLGNDYIEFTARFGGKPREIMVPVGRVTAIYARENGQGMAFPPPVDVLAEMNPPPLSLARVPLHEVGAGIDSDNSDNPEAALDLVLTPFGDLDPVELADLSGTAAGESVVHLVPSDAAHHGAAEGGDDGDLPPSPVKNGKRAALKRVK
ncbi:MAG: ClpXP protease specificity-enhancing factor [Giesbergeria sp.]|nr:ClpXP protease specificity-enhancing factor [Giesbergeria sp.]